MSEGATQPSIVWPLPEVVAMLKSDNTVVCPDRSINVRLFVMRGLELTTREGLIRLSVNDINRETAMIQRRFVK